MQAATVVTEASHRPGFVELDSQIDEYHTVVAQFRHVICPRRSVRRQRFAAMSLFFVAADAYSQSVNFSAQLM